MERSRLAASGKRWDVADTILHCDAKLTRQAVAEALTDQGYSITASTLATMATRGGGPPYARWGRRAIYLWGSSLAWAEARMGTSRRTTSDPETPSVDGTAPGVSQLDVTGR